MGVARTESGIAYEVAGSGPAVLLLHTGLMDRRSWEPLWPALAGRFGVIRYDGHAFGESDDPGELLSEHGDAIEVLDAVGAERAALVGVSWGGRVAVDAALASPDRVTAVVAVSARPSGWRDDDDLRSRLDAVDDVHEAGGFDAVNEAEMRIWVDGPHRTPDEVDTALRAEVSRVNRKLLERQEPLEPEEEELQPPAAERLAELEAPMLVVNGALDHASVLEAGRAIATASGAARIEIEQAGHLAHLEQPDRFLDAIVPFLERHA
jgi:3-oxoadipate enol-lactonase